MQLLKLRYFQLKRDLGYWVVIIAAAAFYLCYYVSMISRTHSVAFTIACILALYSYQFNRKDFAFIEHYLHPTRWQIGVNYGLLMLPFFAGLILAGYWEHTLLLLFSSTLISLLRPKISTQRFLFLNRFVPAEHFEWISGLRRNLYIIVLLLLLAAFLSPVKFFGLLALFLLNMTFLGFYSFYEPLLMLNPHHLTAHLFLKQKVDFTNRMLLMINAPLLLVNAIFNFESAWFSLCFLFGFMIVGSCAVYIKYAHYQPNGIQGFRIDFFILIAGVLIPYLLPLCLYVYYVNRKKAITNLSHYLHDTHPNS